MSIIKRIYTAALLSAAVSIQTMIAPNALSHQPGCITGQIDHRGWFNAAVAAIDNQVELTVKRISNLVSFSQRHRLTR